MGKNSEFFKILEGKINNDSAHSPLQNNFTHPSLGPEPAHLAYLLGQVNRHTPISTKGFKSYPRPRPAQRKAHILTLSQQAAFDFFLIQGAELHPGFHLTELKKCFRMLAKKLHPDVVGGEGRAFIELKKSFECLKGALRDANE